MLRPNIQAPTFWKDLSANWLSAPVVPPPLPKIVSLNTLVGKNQPISSGPRTPRGFSRLWSGPAANPSIETPIAATLTLLIRRLPLKVLVFRNTQRPMRVTAVDKQVHSSGGAFDPLPQLADLVAQLGGFFVLV